MLQQRRILPVQTYKKLRISTNQRLKCVFFLLGTLLFVCPSMRASHRNPILSLDLDAPRNFGYVIGDIIHHRISLNIIKPYSLETDYLPQPGTLTDGLEIHQLRVREQQSKQLTEYRIDLDYLILKSSKDAERIFIPEFPIRLYDGEHSVTASIPKWGFSTAPLIPSQTKDENVHIRPGTTPPRRSISTHYWVLSIIAGAIVLLSMVMAWQRKLLSFLNLGSGPFKQTCRNLKRWRGAEPMSPAYRQALQAVHKALNETAGKAVFADYLNEFFDCNPHFDPLREPTEIFFKISCQTFFEQPHQLDLKNYPVSWLENLCHRFRKIERSA